ncbi:MAG: tyrosinase family protein [Solirubrobacteraceae bacterium]
MNAAGAVLVRREISSLAPNDPIVTEYAAAVKRMKQREPDDPTSWSYQANIHGTETEPPKNLWNQCQHATWYFLPWHRMYLFHFERIVRAAVVENGGPDDWALPYWNYCLGGQNAFLPGPFQQPPPGQESSLYAERNPRLNKGQEGMPLAVTSPARALERPHYIGRAEFGGPETGFQHSGRSWGVLEREPHNAVHVFVEGLMQSPDTAAQDPIFWLHHANIDRLWSEWIGMPGAHHEDPASEAWRKFSFSLFDEQGREVSMGCEDVLDTSAQLGYIYDTESAPAPAPAPAPERAPAPPAAEALTTMSSTHREMIGATQESVTLTGEQVTVPVPIDPQAAEGFGEAVHAYLNIEEIEGERNPGVVYLVYADLERDEAPHPESPHHVGTLSFFGIERASNPVGDEAAHTLQSSYDITPIARELQGRGEWAGHELPVTFAPLGPVPLDAAPNAGVTSRPHEERPIRLGRLSVFYDS